jgi:hypothetical protein
MINSNEILIETNVNSEVVDLDYLRSYIDGKYEASKNPFYKELFRKIISNIQNIKNNFPISEIALYMDNYNVYEKEKFFDEILKVNEIEESDEEDYEFEVKFKIKPKLFEKSNIIRFVVEDSNSLKEIKNIPLEFNFNKENPYISKTINKKRSYIKVIDYSDKIAFGRDSFVIYLDALPIGSTIYLHYVNKENKITLIKGTIQGYHLFANKTCIEKPVIVSSLDVNYYIKWNIKEDNDVYKELQKNEIFTNTYKLTQFYADYKLMNYPELYIQNLAFNCKSLMIKNDNLFK